MRHNSPRALSQLFTAGLSGVLTQLSALPGIGIARLDAYTLLNDIVADPQSYGLTNARGDMRDARR